MPWQRHVVDIATQYRLDAQGQRAYKYRTVVVTVPRQSGKTTLMTPVRVHRIMTRPGIDAFSTAQTGKAARDRILKMVEQVEMSALSPLFKPLRSNGAEGLKVNGTNSRCVRFSPVTGALHGETPHLVDFDEIWRYPEELGHMLLGGARPDMHHPRRTGAGVDGLDQGHRGLDVHEQVHRRRRGPATIRRSRTSPGRSRRTSTPRTPRPGGSFTPRSGTRSPRTTSPPRCTPRECPTPSASVRT